MTWANANNALSHSAQVGIQRTKQGFFLSWINQLALQTFGPNMDDDSITHHSILATTPRALTDAQFQFCMNYIRTGQVPDDKQFARHLLTPTEQMVAEKVGSTLQKEAVNIWNSASSS